MSKSKEDLLTKLNQETLNHHEAATQKAIRAGTPVPPQPVLRTAHDLDFPKWVYKGWKESKKGDGHFEAAESVLVHTPAALAALGGGWTDAPPGSATKHAPAYEAKHEPEPEAKPAPLSFFKTKEEAPELPPATEKQEKQPVVEVKPSHKGK